MNRELGAEILEALDIIKNNQKKLQENDNKIFDKIRMINSMLDRLETRVLEIHNKNQSHIYTICEVQCKLEKIEAWLDSLTKL